MKTPCARKVLDYINAVGGTATRSELRKRFSHTSPRLLQEILIELVEDAHVTMHNDVDAELDAFISPKGKHPRAKLADAPAAATVPKTLREELDALFNEEPMWTARALRRALPHRSEKYLDIGLGTERKAGRLVRVAVDGETQWMRPKTAATLEAQASAETDQHSDEEAAVVSVTIDAASRAGDTADVDSSPASKPDTIGSAEMIPEDPASAPARAARTPASESQPAPLPGTVDVDRLLVADVLRWMASPEQLRIQCVSDVLERSDAGLKKYGTRLQAGNGRDYLWDAYQEAVDACMYLRQGLVDAPDELMDEYQSAVGLMLRLRQRLSERSRERAGS